MTDHNQTTQDVHPIGGDDTAMVPEIVAADFEGDTAVSEPPLVDADFSGLAEEPTAEEPVADEPVAEAPVQVSWETPLAEGQFSALAVNNEDYNIYGLRVGEHANIFFPITMQSGNPAVIGVTGWTNEQLIQLVINRLGRQNARLPSPHNVQALVDLRRAHEGLVARNAEQAMSPLAGMNITNTPN